MIRTLLGIALSFSLCTICSAQDVMRAPKEELEARSPMALSKTEGGGGELLFQCLRDVISKVDGARCPMYPTDTQFAVEAARRHGLVLGLLFFVDRLFHEWSETKKAPTIVVHGRKRFYDPLDANDFWLRREVFGPNLEGDADGPRQGDHLPEMRQ